MASATYEFKVDTKRDGTYGASIDDLTGRLIGQAAWNTGMQTAYQDFAPPARLTVQLDNSDGAFNPDVLGAEALTNGNFASWSGGNPSSWTVTGEVGANPEISQVSADALHGVGGTGAANFYSTSASVSISQTALTIGTTYCITFSITAVDTTKIGYIGIYDNATLVSPRYHLTGNYTLYINATSTTFKIMSTNAVNMTIDNVSVKPTAKYGNILSEGMLGRLRATFNAVTYTLYIGRLYNYQPTPGANSRRVVTLQFNDPMYDLLDTEFQPTLQYNITPDVAMDEVFDKPVVPFPYPSNYWILGVQGSSELDLTTTLYQAPTTAFDTGQSTYAFSGDNAIQGDGGISAQQFLRDMVAGEVNGRFFYDPALPGFTFHDRHRDGQNTTVTFTITENDYEPDNTVYLRENVVNKSRVSYQPRKVASDYAVLWAADQYIPIEGSSLPVQITARYRDASNPSVRIGGASIYQLSPGTDYIAVRNPDLTNVTNSVSVNMVSNANSAVITIYNPNTYSVTITLLQIRGIPITTFNPRTVEAIDGDSVRSYKQTSEEIDLRAVSDDNFAQSVASWRVNLFSDPVSTFQQVAWIANKTDARMTNALNLEVRQRITVSDSWLGHNADYIAVGFRHTVTWGGDHTHETTAILKPYFREKAWILDTSVLDSTTALGL